MGEDQVRNLRHRLRAGGRCGRNGYAAELRHEVVALAHEWRRRGHSQRELAANLGLSLGTLANWIRRAAAPAARIRAVEVIDGDDDAGKRGLVAVLPCGVRLEGLTLADAIELARRLR